MVLWNQKSIPNHSLSSNPSTDLTYLKIKQEIIIIIGHNIMYLCIIIHYVSK